MTCHRDEIAVSTATGMLKRIRTKVIKTPSVRHTGKRLEDECPPLGMDVPMERITVFFLEVGIADE